MIRVKICGITNPTDARAAVRAGADALGFNFAKGPRKIPPERAKAIIATLPPFVTPVALFVDETPERIREVCALCGATTVQLHGDEWPRMVDRLHGLTVIKAFRVQTADDLKRLHRYNVAGFLLDTYVPGKLGGTGVSFRWEIAREAKQYGPIIVAGGLTPDNVADAVRAAEPYGVDVATGVEREPGIKDAKLMQAFVEAARGED